MGSNALPLRRGVHRLVPLAIRCSCAKQTYDITHTFGEVVDHRTASCASRTGRQHRCRQSEVPSFAVGCRLSPEYGPGHTRSRIVGRLFTFFPAQPVYAMSSQCPERRHTRAILRVDGHISITKSLLRSGLSSGNFVRNESHFHDCCTHHQQLERSGLYNYF